MPEFRPVAEVREEPGIQGVGIDDLFVETLPGATLYARCLCSSCPDAHLLADDLVQDAAIAILRYQKKLASPQTFHSLLRLKIRQLYIDWWRRRSCRREETLEADVLDKVSNRPGDRSATSSAMRLHEALGELSETERRIILLRSLVGLSIEELSILEGCRVRAMEKRVERAQCKVLKCLLSCETLLNIREYGDDLEAEALEYFEEAVRVMPDLTDC